MKHFLCFLLLCIITFPALAAEPYKVENVKINMKGVNPVEAREKALDAAQIKAFRALFKGLNKGEALPFDESRVSGLVEDFELVDEQIAPSRYAATYTFRFDRIASQELLRQSQFANGAASNDLTQNVDDAGVYNAPKYSDLYKNPNARDFSAPMDANAAYGQGVDQKTPLLLPYWKIGNQVTLWDQNNVWKDTWRRLEGTVNNSNVFMLPIGDLSDMRLTTPAIPERVENIQQLLSRYQTDEIIVAVGQKASSSITTTLYRADPDGLIFWKVIDSPMGPSEDPYSVAVGQVIAEMRGSSNPAVTSRIPAVRQKDVNVVVPAEDKPFYTAQAAPITSTIRATSQFASPKQWLQLKSNMTPENGIQKIRVLSLTPRSASVELHLSKSFPEIQRLLSARNVALKQTGESVDGYILKFIGS